MDVPVVARGKLTVFLGVAPGVGKTFAMLCEGRRLADEGVDVVVALVQTHDRAETRELVAGLSVMPPRTIAHQGASFGELDLDAVIARSPAVALVDELAHTNVPGCRNGKRWQDVDDLLEAGIDVVSALNVAHLDSLHDAVEELTGVALQETVPDEFVAAAERVELIDRSPETLRQRIQQGRVFTDDEQQLALGGYFSTAKLAGLGELGRTWLQRRELWAQRPPGSGWLTVAGQAAGAVVVALTGEPEGEHVLRRAAAIAARRPGELVGVHVHAPSGLLEAEPKWLASQRRLLVELGGRYAEVAGTDVAHCMVEFARREHAAELVLGETRRTRAFQLIHGSVIHRAVREAAPVEVHIVPFTRPARHPLHLDRPRLRLRPRQPRAARRVPLPARRRALGWLLAVVAPAVALLVTVPLRADIGLAGALLTGLLAVVLVAAIGGVTPAIAATVLVIAGDDYYFTLPLHSFRVDRGVDLVALLAFAAVACVVGLLVDVLARRGVQVARAETEAAGLARLAARTLAIRWSPDHDTETDLLQALRRTFDLDVVAVLEPCDGAWRIVAAAGTPVPTDPARANKVTPLPGGRVLTLTGDHLDTPDATLLRAFVAELALTDERQELQRSRARKRSR
jgi:two-component system, OmpR family, sensor histidine kinase KdpD